MPGDIGGKNPGNRMNAISKNTPKTTANQRLTDWASKVGRSPRLGSLAGGSTGEPEDVAIPVTRFPLGVVPTRTTPK